ncbi:class I lanthipeptide [Taibaiella helva]|uniref:class I lanthipeptide n=1 Tax=Taibaiella helva TaxID=2301235 RepID=UPI0018E527DB
MKKKKVSITGLKLQKVIIADLNSATKGIIIGGGPLQTVLYTNCQSCQDESITDHCVPRVTLVGQCSVSPSECVRCNTVTFCDWG